MIVDKVNTSKGSPQMSNMQRELYLRLIDDHAAAMPVVYQINNYRYCFEISRWLYENSITGRILIDFLKVKFENSIMEMVKFIIMKINNDREKKPIYAYKDYKI
tara:strand:- start:595 stop:906 length:312 start_codon:yes stop_codon:yes gene_type:complete